MQKKLKRQVYLHILTLRQKVKHYHQIGQGRSVLRVIGIGIDELLKIKIMPRQTTTKTFLDARRVNSGFFFSFLHD